MSKSQSEFPSLKKLCRALHSVLQRLPELLLWGVKTRPEVSDVRAPVARQGRAEHFANNEQ